MKAQVQLELQDYLDAQKLHFRQPNHIRFLSTLILAFLVILFLVSESTYRKNYIYFFLIFLAISGIALLYRYVFLHPRTKRIFEQNKFLHLPVEVEITEEAMVTSAEYGHTEQPWSMFFRWKEGDEMLILYSSEASYTILPKRFFTAEQIEAAKTYLQANQVPTNLPRRPGYTCLMILGSFGICLLFVLIGFFLQSIGQ